MGKSKNKKQKNELIFDNQKREEFLKGFSKRKKQRQVKAQKEIEQKLKDERKRIREESKNLKDKYKQSFKQIEECNDILEEEEMEGVTIQISSINENAGKKFIGVRKIDYESSESEENVNDHEGAENNIEGMDVVGSKNEENKVDKKMDLQLKELKTEKDFKKMIKKQTKSALKKSKVVQMKNRLNHKRNVKLSNRKKYFKDKFLKKHKKIPKQFNNNRNKS